MVIAKFVVTYETPEGDEVKVELPSKWAICSRCDGHAKHVNPNVDGHGISQEEFDEDPDFRENYFSGVYDIGCLARCQDGKVVVADEEAMNKEQLTILNNWYIAREERAREDEYDAQVRRMENGGYE